jgi:hypothetical protein
MKDQIQQLPIEDAGKPEYVAPVVRMMSESEVLSAFQVTAAGTTTWWAM